MVTRADSFTPLKKQQEYFSDFLNSFAKTPVGNQLARLTNVQSVNQSIQNLIKTNLGERLFQPSIGGNVHHSLFENINQPMINNLEYYIERTITQNEPRAVLLNVEINPLEDWVTLNVTITYTLINNPDPIVLDVILKKVR